MGLTTNRADECIKLIRPDGQQECYLVLPREELAKGFVRPVRRSYTHLKCGSVTTMAPTIAETYARQPDFYGGTFCVGCGAHFDLTTPRAARRRLAMYEPGEEIPESVRHIKWNFAWYPPDGSYVGE